MMKFYFYVSLAVAVVNLAALFFYTSHHHTVRHSSFSTALPVLIGLILFASLLIWWIAFFSMTKHFSVIYAPVVFFILFLVCWYRAST